MMMLTEIDDEDEEHMLAEIIDDDDQLTSRKKTHLKKMSSMHEVASEIIDDDDQLISRKKTILPKKMSSMHEVAFLQHEMVQESIGLRRGQSSRNNKMSTTRNLLHVEAVPSKRVMYETPIEKLKRVSRRVYSQISVESRVDDLKEKKPLAKTINDQYDTALKRVYLREWPDAVPEFENQHRCCCRRDPERDHHAWEILKEVFPRYIFVLMVASGAIAPRSKVVLAVVTGVWCFYCLLLTYTATITIFLIDKYALCLLGPNCIPRDANLSFASLIAMFLSDLSNIITIILVQIYVRKLLQSRELLTLIFSVDPARVRKPKWQWVVVFAVYWAITVGLSGFALIRMATTDQIVLMLVRALSYMLYALAPMANLIFFFLVSHTLCLSYDDWTAKMIAASEKSLLSVSRSQFRLIEVNLLQKLEARVALSALLTRNTAVLLVPVLLAVTSFFFYFLAMLTSPSIASVGTFFDALLGIGLRQGLPLVFALFVSLRVNTLENVVALASLQRISKFLEYAPMKWMLTQKMSIDPDLFSEIIRGLLVVFTTGSVLVATTVQGSALPWDIKYNNYGSCADGIRSGHEQHIDCGGPESNCPLTCREKYGEYIVIPADRDCTQVDGFVHITTQRACTAAYRTWARSNNRTNTVSNTEVYEGVRGIQALQERWQQADWSDGFRCGAFSMPRVDFVFETFNRVSFPALFSSWENNNQGQKPYAYLCYHSAGSCKVRKSGEDDIHFEEMLSCPGTDPVFASAWRNISGPFPRLANYWRNAGFVSKFHASVGSEGDCAEIEVLNSGHSGAQVVFALACNVTDPANQCRKSNNVKVTVEHYHDSIQDIIGGAGKKVALMVSPIASMANATVYDLKIKSQDIVVKSGSTFFLIADQSSGSMKIRLCV